MPFYSLSLPLHGAFPRGGVGVWARRDHATTIQPPQYREGKPTSLAMAEKRLTTVRLQQSTRTEEEAYCRDTLRGGGDRT